MSWFDDFLEDTVGFVDAKLLPDELSGTGTAELLTVALFGAAGASVGATLGASFGASAGTGGLGGLAGASTGAVVGATAGGLVGASVLSGLSYESAIEPLGPTAELDVPLDERALRRRASRRRGGLLALNGATGQSGRSKFEGII